MSTLQGRWRVDQRATGEPTEWFEHQHDAEARVRILDPTNNGCAIAWHWPGEYIETAAEEVARMEVPRMVREQMVAALPWLRLPEGDVA